MEWIASTLHTTSEHGVSWTRPFRRRTKFGFCACVITFQLASTLRRLTKNYKKKLKKQLQ